jgi:hypothetical protein
MRRFSLAVLCLVLAACPRDKKVAVRDSIPVDTTTVDSTDLASLETSLPPAAPDTFRRQKLTAEGTVGPSYAAAPSALMEAVQREQSFSRFCYQEYGQKSDPSLAGGVAMVVTVGSQGITDAHVGNARWSSSAAGRAVNRCLNERAKRAWRLEPGVVKPGQYVVQLSFRGT